MHILVTGAAGRVGSHTVKYLLARQHTITAVDLVPLSSTLLNSVPAPDRQRLHTATCDLTNYERFESILNSAATPVEGIVHLGSIPDPTKHDSRVVHNSNVAGSYNVMETAGKLGIKRVVQASSVNATGLSYTPEHNHRLPDLPFREDITPLRPEDSYALSKLICEAQASAVARFWAPQLRIASLRFHFCVPNRQYAVEHAVPRDMFSWTSFDACASACLLALTSEGWDGHEVFNIAAKDIIHHGTLDDHTAIDMDRTPVGTLEILEKHWSGRYGKLDEEWWKNDKRRAIWDSTKAERILGWNHDRSGEL